MKKLLIVVMIMVLSVSFAFAQEELDTKKLDAGLRGGPNSGITARYFLSEGNSAEVLLTYHRGIILTGLYEWHKPLQIGEVEGLSWFFGGGLHVGYWVNGSIWDRHDIALGLAGIVGVEYDLEPLINFPISVSLDYKPGFDILGGWTDSWSDAAFSVRYAF
ncbi:MAG: hypothetical protein KAH15_04680 [Candidatus Marinimicrobia bacterium]|nr:hypothetical protein [Candidatus Neomarinimicrobiota bacterium]